MSLLDQALADHAAIAQDTELFAVSAVVTNPDGDSLTVSGQWNDISEALDPETGVLVSARQVWFLVVDQTLVDAGLGRPAGTSESKRKPWTVARTVGGVTRLYKVNETVPDGVFGSTRLILEFYRR